MREHNSTIAFSFQSVETTIEYGNSKKEIPLSIVSPAQQVLKSNIVFLQIVNSRFFEYHILHLCIDSNPPFEFCISHNGIQTKS